jgi:spermidine synthase
VTWVPTWRVAATFARAFPYVLDLGSIMVGSPDPIEYDPDVIRARVEHPFTQAYYARAGIDVAAAAAQLLKAADYRVDVAGVPEDVNRDLHPKDEYGR